MRLLVATLCFSLAGSATAMPSAAPSAATLVPPAGPSYAEWQALAASGQQGLFRLRYAGLKRKTPLFRLDGVGPARTATDWLAADTGPGPGVYFFESVDGRSPRQDGGRLTPPIRLRCRGREPGLLVSGFAYFNAERVECRCWRRRAVDPHPRTPGHELPPVHARGVIYNEGDLVFSAGFRLAGAARAGGTLELRDRAELVADPRSSEPWPRRRFPPPAWEQDVDLPTTWPMPASARGQGP